MTRIILTFFLWATAVPCFAQEPRPLDVLKGSVDQVLSILKDPLYKKGAPQNEQRERLWAIIRDAFDFDEMCRRTLAKNWTRFNTQQQTEFSDLFAVFLRNIYLSKIQGGFEGEKVEYSDEEMITDSKAVVKTLIIRKDIEIPIDYRLLKENGTWRVYDVIVEGKSMVQNYRAQFSKELMRGTPSQLIDQIKTKVEEQEKGQTGEDKTGIKLELERLASRLFASLMSGLKTVSKHEY